MNKKLNDMKEHGMFSRNSGWVAVIFSVLLLILNGLDLLRLSSILYTVVILLVLVGTLLIMHGMIQIRDAHEIEQLMNKEKLEA